MAYLFSITSPLCYRFNDGDKQLVGEYFNHPQGLLIFEPFWDQAGEAATQIHVYPGMITGEGPWRVGELRLYVLGCHHTDASLALLNEQWQFHRQSIDYAAPEHIIQVAKQFGAISSVQAV